MKTNILVIEDDEEIRNDIADILEYVDMACIVAQDGEIGEQLAREFLPDLIICDIMMPGMDGYSVLLDLQGDPLTANIPFFFLTAKVDRASFRYGMELGADDYLTKPFTAEELIAAVKVRLEKKAGVVREYDQRAKELRESLLHSLPHELRTPLFGMMGGAEMLLRDASSVAPEDIRSMAGMILESGKRLQRQIENYLFYAQLEITRLDPERAAALQQTTDYPATLIRDAAVAAAEKAERIGDLVVKTEESVVSMSAENLQKAVAEIVDNAFKFSKPGAQVTVSAEIQGNTYVLEVSDQGRGMSMEQIKKAGAFMQFGRELYEQQGSGLGLTVAKRLVELHQGEFLIQSEPERGTRVRMKLPIPSMGGSFSLAL